jgi:RsiW-degrading membrane proteinase PrsW (M82 family)
VPWDLALPLTAAGSGAAWARLATARAGGARSGSTALALLGGVAAAGLAVATYELSARLGLDLRWDSVTSGGATALVAAAAIGLVEESAKLAGILLVAERGAPRPSVLAASIGVAAGFAAVEAVMTLRGEPSASALARAALGPVAHALLSVPLAAGVAAATGSRTRRWHALPAALLASAALHGAGDLGVAVRGAGRLAYAAALAAPALALFGIARRPGAARK